MNFIPTDLRHHDALGAVLIREHLLHGETNEQALNARKILKYYNPVAYNQYWASKNINFERSVESLIRKMKYQSQKRNTHIQHIYNEFLDIVDQVLLSAWKDDNERILISEVDLPPYLENSIIEDMYQLNKEIS